MQKKTARKLEYTLIMLLACVLLTACAPSPMTETSVSTTPRQDSGKISVVTTIFPSYDFVREIAGDNVELTMLLPPGSESHSFEPTPQDIIKIQDCDLFIYNGGESDAWVNRILDSLDTSNIQVLAMMSCVDTVEEELVEGMQHSHAEEEAELDEHVWTSPKNAKLIVQAISDSLQGLDSRNAPSYAQNTDSYLEELNVLDAAFEDVAQNGNRRVIVFGDRFPLRYFADAYGLEYYAAFPGCSGETEASAQTVAFLIDKVNDEQIPVVFHIEFSNELIADTICEATGAKKTLFHTCHNVSKEDIAAGTSYIGLMTQNLANLKEALA